MKTSPLKLTINQKISFEISYDAKCGNLQTKNVKNVYNIMYKEKIHLLNFGKIYCHVTVSSHNTCKFIFKS